MRQDAYCYAIRAFYTAKDGPDVVIHTNGLLESHGLLDSHELALAGPPEAVRIPVELIDPNPRNPRDKLVELDALAENLKAFGLLQPVTVRRTGERYELLGGHRRTAAFALLRDREPLDPQWRTIPAVVRSFDDDDSFLALISAQVHTAGWRPREEAAALERLVVSGLTLRQVGERLNRSEGWASKRLRVYADAVLSAYVQIGQLAPGVAEELLPMLDPAARQQFAERAVKEEWSKDQARGYVRGLRLSSQLGDLGKKARELVELLSQIDGPRITVETFRDLWLLHGRIDVLAAEARGVAPKMPTIAQAEKAAGVKTQERPPKRDRRGRPVNRGGVPSVRTRSLSGVLRS